MFPFRFLRSGQPERLESCQFPRLQGRKIPGLGTGEVAVSLGSLIEQIIVFSNVRLADIEVNLELSGQSSNLDPLLARAKAALGDKDSAAGSDSASFGGKKFIVNRFVIEGVGVNATLDMYGEAADVKLRLPRIKSNNVIYAVHTQQFNEKQ